MAAQRLGSERRDRAVCGFVGSTAGVGRELARSYLYDIVGSRDSVRLGLLIARHARHTSRLLSLPERK